MTTSQNTVPPPPGTATDTEGWPPAAPRAEPRPLQLDGCPDEQELADYLLYEHLSADYLWAADLGWWITRDGPRWVPASRDAITGYIAACAELTDADPVAGWPVVQERFRRFRPKWAGQEPVPYTWTDPRTRCEHTITAEDARSWVLLQRLRTPAVQGRIAALMQRKAHFEIGDMMPLVTDTRQLDAEPGIFWAGGYPWDLTRSADGPVLARADGGQPWRLDWPHMMGSGYLPDIRVLTPGWDKLTAAIFPDPAEREHALDTLSHGLHGWPTDAAALARSFTGTGKSFLASLISDLLGDYAGQVAAPTLFGRSGSSQFAFDEMRGARFVVMNEGRKADFAATEAFKAVVSPDPLVNARARHERQRRLVPARHTLLLTVNPAADLDYADPAVVRRLIPLGFTGNPAEIRDIGRTYGTANEQGLAAWRAEAPGVLAQLIMRCARVLSDPTWYGTRESAPETVMSRFAAVAAEADPFGRWLDERTCDGLLTPTGDLLADYRCWCEANHETPMCSQWFGRALASHGIERARTGSQGTRGWKIALRES
jgi:hypothetical protein